MAESLYPHNPANIKPIIISKLTTNNQVNSLTYELQKKHANQNLKQEAKYMTVHSWSSITQNTLYFTNSVRSIYEQMLELFF